MRTKIDSYSLFDKTKKLCVIERGGRSVVSETRRCSSSRCYGRLLISSALSCKDNETQLEYASGCVGMVFANQ